MIFCRQLKKVFSLFVFLRLCFPFCLCCFFLASCAANKFVSSTGNPGVNIAGSKLGVYSLLDVRENFLGEQFVGEMHRQLKARFAEMGVGASVFIFRESSVGQGFAWSGEGEVPVGAFVGEHHRDEVSGNIKYRLLLFPNNMVLNGLGRHFELTWILQDVTSGKSVWQGVYRGLNGIDVNGDSNPDKYVGYIINSLLIKLAEVKVIGEVNKSGTH